MAEARVRFRGMDASDNVGLESLCDRLLSEDDPIADYNVEFAVGADYEKAFPPTAYMRHGIPCGARSICLHVPVAGASINYPCITAVLGQNFSYIRIVVCGGREVIQIDQVTSKVSIQGFNMDDAVFLSGLLLTQHRPESLVISNIAYPDGGSIHTYLNDDNRRNLAQNDFLRLADNGTAVYIREYEESDLDILRVTKDAVRYEMSPENAVENLALARKAFAAGKTFTVVTSDWLDVVSEAMQTMSIQGTEIFHAIVTGPVSASDDAISTAFIGINATARHPCQIAFLDPSSYQKIARLPMHLRGLHRVHPARQ